MSIDLKESKEKKEPLQVKANPKLQKLEKAPDKVLAMALREMIKKSTVQKSQ